MTTSESIDASGVLATLCAPFESLHSREGAGGKSFTYVAGGDVMDRVLLATSGAFEFEILDIRLIEPQTKQTRSGQKTVDPFWMVHARLTIEGLGRRDAVGTAAIENEDSPKGAETDAFKRCAVKFGVALQLYRKDEQQAATGTSGRRPAATASSNGNGSNGKHGPMNDTGAQCPKCYALPGKAHLKPCI